MLNDPFCKQEHGFTEKNTLLVDSDSRKVQLWLDNSLINEPYSKEDLCLLPRADNVVRNNVWQEAYLEQLTQQILAVAENASDDVRAYLREHRLPQFTP